MRRRKGAEVSASECIVGDCRGNRSPKTPSHQLIVPEGEHFVLLDRGPEAEPALVLIERCRAQPFSVRSGTRDLFREGVSCKGSAIAIKPEQ